MTTPGAAISFDRVVKNFRFFASPFDRLKEALHPARKIYHTPLPVLRDVSFKIERGQTVAIMGPNGVGKSTLLHVAAGVLEPTAGTVTISGSVASLLELAGGFAQELTGRENIRFLHDVIGKGVADVEESERIVQSFAEIGDHFDRPIRTYSSGMLLRLGFAAAICSAPDILLVDEVIAVGDARFQQKCFTRIRELRDRGTTILFVTHMAEMVLGLCDRVLVLDRGELVFDGAPGVGVERYYQLFFNAPERPSIELSENNRLATGDAQIVSTFATRDGVSAVSRFERGERITVVMEVVFERAVATPHFGFSCSTKEGVRVYATATTLLGASPAAAAAGERRRVEFIFELTGTVADLFIDLSVFEVEHGGVTVHDARMAVLQLTVTSLRYCLGLVDLDASFAESTLRRGNDEAPLPANYVEASKSAEGAA